MSQEAAGRSGQGMMHGTAQSTGGIGQGGTAAGYSRHGGMASGSDKPSGTAAGHSGGTATGKTPDSPFAVATVNSKVAGWLDRLGEIWVEGEILQANLRPGAWMQYLTLRDLNPKAKASATISIEDRVLRASGLELVVGSHVVVLAKPNFYQGNGSFSLRASSIRPVGVGAVLARIEQLKSQLAAEGLFDPARKRPLPFLPQRIGLITGRNSDALHDVVRNASLRWPAAEFEVREVAVQGAQAVREVTAALAQLDAQSDVDVIVIARGGGALEDLLPFSDESLVRAAAACRTPLVSAIGHEKDNPLLDYVADLRASTPTDAAKRVVPDVTEQRQLVSDCVRAARLALASRLDREARGLEGLRSRPVMAKPWTLVDSQQRDISYALATSRHVMQARLLAASGEISALAATVRTLSPASTLDRGYAVVQGSDGRVLRSRADAAAGDVLRIRLAQGQLTAQVA